MARSYLTTLASRERNRIHARKTRQRKKEQMQHLLSQADYLKAEQVRLRQVINEKNTASILVGLFAKAQTGSETNEDPIVEALLRRSVEDIPDSTKITELPALILPGQHASKKIKMQSAEQTPSDQVSDGIDYDLLGKDRSKCSPEELDQIRRERNRMHAKRTRDRKRVFMEEMGELCRKLEEENVILRQHLAKTDPNHELVQSKPSHEVTCTVSTLSNSNSPGSDSNLSSLTSPYPSNNCTSAIPTDSRPLSNPRFSHDQLKALLVAADSCNDENSRKRPRSVFSRASAKAPNPVSDDNSSLGESQSE